jgi:hypothetical protein
MQSPHPVLLVSVLLDCMLLLRLLLLPIFRKPGGGAWFPNFAQTMVLLLLLLQLLS